MKGRDKVGEIKELLVAMVIEFMYNHYLILELADELGCKVGSLPFTNLGLLPWG